LNAAPSEAEQGCELHRGDSIMCSSDAVQRVYRTSLAVAAIWSRAMRYILMAVGYFFCGPQSKQHRLATAGMRGSSKHCRESGAARPATGCSQQDSL
jgi:hypothetical protein